MSASDKKKLRAAERAEKLTEKQLAEQKEAKKLKIMTTAFVVVLALMVVFAAFTAVTKTIEGRGIREKNTVALTIGDHEISNAELNYYFIDSVNEFYSNYGAYASFFGLDTTKPLSEQIVDEATGKTWADDFMDAAVENAKAIYALNDAAAAAGFTLTEDQLKDVDTAMQNAQFTALYYYGYTNLQDYLKAMYGNGATEEGFRNYITMSYTADAYRSHYNDGLTYDDAAIRAAEAEDFNAYTSYSYNTYEVKVSSYEDAAAAEADAKILTAEEINSVEALNAAIAALPVNAEATAASIATNDVFAGSINSLYAEWVTDASRKAGDVNYFEKTSTSTDENGTETTKIDSYYVVMFTGSNDNNFGMSNVRHILVTPEGGTYDSATGLTNYTDEEKATAKAEAEALLNEWKSGDATEDSFAALANEKSDDGDGTTGGLYTEINPSTNFVTNFKNWALADHEVGDTEIVETEFGYHIMYYCGQTEQTYRDYMIENDLRNADLTEWYNNLMENVTSEVKDTKYISTDLVLSSN